MAVRLRRARVEFDLGWAGGGVGAEVDASDQLVGEDRQRGIHDAVGATAVDGAHRDWQRNTGGEVGEVAPRYERSGAVGVVVLAVAVEIPGEGHAVAAGRVVVGARAIQLQVLALIHLVGTAVGRVRWGVLGRRDVDGDGFVVDLRVGLILVPRIADSE